MQHPLKNKSFKLLLSYRMAFIFAIQIQGLCASWEIYKITHSPFYLGTMGLIEAIPAILSSFFSGHIVDTHRPYRIMLLATLLTLVNALLLPYFYHSVLFLFATVFFSGIVRSFLSPTTNTLIPQLIHNEMAVKAAALNSSSFQLAAILGPCVGGLLYAYAGEGQAFKAPFFFFLLALILLHVNQEIKAIRPALIDRLPFWQSLKEGIAFTYSNKLLFSAMTLDMISVLFGGVTAILPMMAHDIFRVGALGLGLLRSSTSVGAVAIGFYLALRPIKELRGSHLLYAVFGFGLSLLAFSSTKHFYWALFFLFVSGLFDGLSMVIRGTILQLTTPSSMRGRVAALNSIFITSSNEIGAFESGLAAGVLGLIPSLYFGGTMTLLTAIGVAYFFPQLAKTKIAQIDR